MPATPIELCCFVIWFLWKLESFTCWYYRRYSVQKIGVLSLTATSPLLECLWPLAAWCFWPVTSSGSFWRRENQSSMENMGVSPLGCCFCCFLIISGGSQQLSVTCVSQTFVPISTYHQTSVIYCYGFAHEMKLHWAVVSVLHSWLDLSRHCYCRRRNLGVGAKWSMHTINEGLSFTKLTRGVL